MILQHLVVKMQEVGDGFTVTIWLNTGREDSQLLEDKCVPSAADGRARGEHYRKAAGLPTSAVDEVMILQELSRRKGKPQ